MYFEELDFVNSYVFSKQNSLDSIEGLHNIEICILEKIYKLVLICNKK